MSTPKPVIKVTAVDLETGEKSEAMVGAGNYVIIATAPCHVAGEQHHANGTTVLTLKGRDPAYLATAYKPPQRPLLLGEAEVIKP